MDTHASFQQPVKDLSVKQAVLELLSQQQVKLRSLAEQLYEQDEGASARQIEFCKSVITEIDALFATPGVEDSLFLRNTLRPLKALRDQAKALLQGLDCCCQEASHCPKALDDDEVLVYIALFQADGLNLDKWALQLRSIQSHLLGRPVYAEETDVQAALRQNNAKTQTGYIVAVIPRNALRGEGCPGRSDRYGKALLSLASASVTSECIREFVHQGQRYVFRDGKLKVYS